MRLKLLTELFSFLEFADVAQLAAQLICNQSVAGSTPVVSSTLQHRSHLGGTGPASVLEIPCRYSIMVSISACHAEDTGSNPVTCSIRRSQQIFVIVKRLRHFSSKETIVGSIPTYKSSA